MIAVRRATSIRNLEALLNKIEADDAQPIIIVDRPGNDLRDPQFTVIWNRGDIDPDR